MPKENSISAFSRTSIFFLNLGLAVLIFFGAELGRLKGIEGQPLQFSLIWPATGISLAALLILDYRMWPGIFLGNFTNNFYNLIFNENFANSTIMMPLLASIIISFGSLFQALAGNIIMRTFATKTYFSTVKDIIIFLIPVGLLTCLIASSIGNLTLFYFYHSINLTSAAYTWLTFWIGDFMGVYIITPLIVVWMLQKNKTSFLDHIGELILILLSFLILTYLIFGYRLPLLYLFIPINIWMSYRFGMHGATLGIFLIAVSIIVPISLGYGPDLENTSQSTLFFVLIILSVLVFVSLVTAAIVNERNLAWKQIENHYVDFQTAMDISKKEITSSPSKDEILKKRMSELGTITSGISRLFQTNINNIDSCINEIKNVIDEFASYFNSVSKSLDQNSLQRIQKDFSTLTNCFKSLHDFQKTTNSTLKIIEHQSILSAPGILKFKTLNINTLLHNSLNKAVTDFTDVNIKIKENYDKEIDFIEGIPDDFFFAFYYLFTLSLQSLKSSKNSQRELVVSTKSNNNTIEIEIRDNGKGFFEKELKDFLHQSKTAGKEYPLSYEKSDQFLPFLIAYDIISHVYHGSLQIESKEEEFLKFKITLPVG